MSLLSHIQLNKVISQHQGYGRAVVINVRLPSRLYKFKLIGISLTSLPLTPYFLMLSLVSRGLLLGRFLKSSRRRERRWNLKEGVGDRLRKGKRIDPLRRQ